jgi:hypothetical protein
MIDKYDTKASLGETNPLYHRGQYIVYKGEEAQVLEVKPVFTISIKGKSHVICGNIFNDVRPSEH